MSTLLVEVSPRVETPFRNVYGNFIGGTWLPPINGRYFDNRSPVDGQLLCRIPRSDGADVEAALDAAHAAKDKWAAVTPAERANILNRIAQRMEDNLDRLATAETWDNGKPIRETKNADIPLAIDHFRYFAGCVRAQEGAISQIDAETVAYHFHEPLGVVGQIIPWNFPILMAAWKLAPALAAGNCVVLKPAEQTPASILVLAELIADLLPPGVLNIVNGFGQEAGQALATSPRIAKIAFTGETGTGRLIMQYASKNLIPVTLELGGKSPNLFFEDVMAQDDAFLDKAIEGFLMFAFNQGEVCTCPSRALDSRKHLRPFHGKSAGAPGRYPAGRPAGRFYNDRRTGVGGSIQEDPELHRHRKAGRRAAAGGRRRGHAAGEPGERLLHSAHHLPGQ